MKAVIEESFFLYTLTSSPMSLDIAQTPKRDVIIITELMFYCQESFSGNQRCSVGGSCYIKGSAESALGGDEVDK